MKTPLTLLVLGLSFGAVCGCSKAPTSPSAPSSPSTSSPSPAAAAQFAGVWEGEWIVGTSTIHWVTVGGAYPFLLRLRNSGDRLEGYVVAHCATSGGDVPVDLIGAMQSGYRVVLDGSRPAASDYDLIGSVTLHVELWFSASTLQGTVACDVSPGYHSAPIREITTGVLGTVVRNPDPSDTFQGTWRGRYLVQTCDLVGWDHCYNHEADHTYPLELTLSQSGGRVSGTLWPDYSASVPADYQYLIDVSGTATGAAMQLTGVSKPYPLNPGVTRRLLNLSATRDGVGRLSGTLTWQEDYVGQGPANLGQLQRMTMSGKVYSVVQVQ